MSPVTSSSSSYGTTPQQQHRQLRSAAEAVVAAASKTSPRSSSTSATPSVHSVLRHNMSVDSNASRNHSLLRHATIRVPNANSSRCAALRPSHTTIPIIVSDDVVSGTQRDGWMSPVRRFFCLLVTFDFLFTGLLWVITVILTGRDVRDAMRQQILEYTIHDSMFDCVIAGALRFLISILFYAMLDLGHWWPVALTTTGTSAFLIAKVFEYQWTRFGVITFDVMLVLLSFILAWGELWMLDFRVLPLEMKAKELLGQFRLSTSDEEDEERAPLLVSAGGDRALLQRYVEGSLWDGSVANFYSPMESPEDSGGEEDEDDFEMEEGTLVSVPRKFRRKTPLNQKEVEYRKIGEEALETAWSVLNSPDWKLEKRVESTGDTVHSKTVKGKKVFKLTGVVDLPPKFLLEELFFRIDHVPSWNPTLIECRTILPIDSHTDISYQVCAEAAGGVVSTRDFVNLRYWKMKEEGTFVAAGVSIKHPAMPPQPKKIRGENGPGGWFMRPVAGDPYHCVFQWLLDTDLKGWIPQYVIDSALSGAQLEYIDNIRKFSAELHMAGRVEEHMSRQQSAAASLNSTAVSAAIMMA